MYLLSHGFVIMSEILELYIMFLIFVIVSDCLLFSALQIDLKMKKQHHQSIISCVLPCEILCYHIQTDSTGNG